MLIMKKWPNNNNLDHNGCNYNPDLHLIKKQKMQMTILLISIILIMKKWNNNNNNLDNETSAVALIILLSPECKVPWTIHRGPRYFQHLWHPTTVAFVLVCKYSQHFTSPPTTTITEGLEWLHQAPMLLVSIFFDRVTAHLTHANESLNMSSLLTHLDSDRHLSTGWSARNLRAWNIFTGRPFEPY